MDILFSCFRESRHNRQLFLKLLLPALLMLCSPIASSVAQAPETASPLKKLLETGWKPSAENYTAAQTQFVQAKHDAPSDVRVDYAMALVSIQNHKLDDASTHLKDALQNGNSLLPIRRVQIWLFMNRSDGAAAQAAMADLAHILKQQSSISNQGETEETTRWLGKVVGFYSGPGSDQSKRGELSALDSEIARGLNEALANAYAGTRTAVATQYSQLQAQLANARRDVQEQNESKLAIDRNQTDAALTIATKKRTAATALVAQMQQIVAIQNPPLNAEGLQLSRQWDRASAELRSLKNELDDAKDSKSDKKSSSRSESSINSDIKDAEKTKADLEKRITEIRVQLRTNANNLVAAQTELLTYSNLEKTLSKKIQALAAQAEKPASSNDPKTAALEQKLKSISTYVSINLERERQRILDSISQPTAAR